MIKVIISTMILQMKQSFTRPMFRFCLIANPILNTILLYEMFRESGATNYMAYVTLGAGLMGLWGCIFFSSSGDIKRERFSGTLALIFTAPARFPTIILGKIIGNTIMSLLTMIISLMTSVIFFRIQLQLADPLYFLIALFAAIVSFIVISSVIACILTLSRKTELYMNCIEIPIILLCGFAFPVSVLPFGIRIVSYTLAPTYAVELMRMAVWGITDKEEFFEKLLLLMILTLIYAVISAFLYKKIDRSVRIAATLEVA